MRAARVVVLCGVIGGIGCGAQEAAPKVAETFSPAALEVCEDE
ncbi:hypothetical protein ACNOYE_06845 [Nannocystaceae bacterium ST9]